MERRLLLVHAHPDDETIATGTTMARYAAEGAQVTLVTCTLGEEGEILIPELAHHASDQSDSLAGIRFKELEHAMAELGVVDWRILGGPGTFRDSGMIGTAPNDRPECFWRADLLTAARHLVEVIRQTRPQVLVTYDDFGGYGHPDHIQAHRVAHYAMTLAAVPSFAPDLGPAWSIAKAYWTAFPISVLRAGILALKAAGDTSDFAQADPDDLQWGTPDEFVTAAIDGSSFVAQKQAAMRAHATQISTEDGFFGLSGDLGGPILGSEYFRLVHGQAAGPFDDQGREIDLFNGLS